MVFKLLKSIEKVVFEGYSCPVKGNEIELREDHPDAKCKNLIIKDAQDVLVYKFDRQVKDSDGKWINEPFQFLTSDKPARSKCDYIIFHARRDYKGMEKLYILICNMKSGQPSNTEDQIRAGRILSEFILNTSIRCHDHWGSRDAGHVALTDNEKLRSMIKWKEIAITTRAPVQKGNEKFENRNTRQTIECNKSYPLERFLR